MFIHESQYGKQDSTPVSTLGCVKDPHKGTQGGRKIFHHDDMKGRIKFWLNFLLYNKHIHIFPGTEVIRQ